MVSVHTRTDAHLHKTASYVSHSCGSSFYCGFIHFKVSESGRAESAPKSHVHPHTCPESIITTGPVRRRERSPDTEAEPSSRAPESNTSPGYTRTNTSEGSRACPVRDGRGYFGSFGFMNLSVVRLVQESVFVCFRDVGGGEMLQLRYHIPRNQRQI